MNQPPLISIITVTFNASALVKNTIQSIAQQTYKNIEYILIDGASTDDTLQVIDAYQTNITKWISEPDKNLYDAMNKGLQMATGDYVLFMNAGDCFYTPFSLEKALENSNHADFIYSRAVSVDENRNEMTWHKRVPHPSHFTYKNFLQGMVVCHQAMLVKRNLCEPYHIQYLAADIDWCISFMKKVKTIHFYDATFCTFLQGGISSKHRWRSVKERFYIAIHHVGLIKAIGYQLRILISILQRVLFGRK